ncbi:GGDEF domain-containing protein [Candidatus Woesearchaeota archaeon]|nr:GGDEF domain-containing protein [Candidatus Woesearchaeota archaeon]
MEDFMIEVLKRVSDYVSPEYKESKDNEWLDCQENLGLSNLENLDQLVIEAVNKLIATKDPEDKKALSSLQDKLNTALDRKAFRDVQDSSLNNPLVKALLVTLYQRNKALERTANFDENTGLYRVGYFRNAIDREMERAKRRNDSKYGLALIIGDIDHFKSFNDTYGHLVGDFVLKKVADIYKKQKRNTDIVARYGGEEFAIIALDTDESGAYKLADRIRKELESNPISLKDPKFREFLSKLSKENRREILEKISKQAGTTSLTELRNYNIQITSSFGIKSYSGESSKEDLIHKADCALYSAKESGRNQAIVYRPGMTKPE